MRLLADASPLRKYRSFRRVWLGQLVSGVGTQLTVVGVAYQAFRLTDSTLVVGLLGLVQIGPLLGGAVVGGALADAKERRRLLLLAQVAMGAASAGLVVNAAASPAVWPLFLCTAVTAAFQGLDWPTRRAVLPVLVGEEDLTSAIALQTTIQQLAWVAGPALGGLAIAGLGLPAVFGLDVASFGAAMVAVLGLPDLPPLGGGTPLGLRSLREGFSYLRRERLLAASYLIDLNAMIFGMPRAVFPALGLELYRGGPGVVGLLYAAPAAGGLVGSLFTGWCAHVRRQGRAILACVALWGAAIAAFGFVPVLGVGLALLVVAGAADVVSAVFRQAVQQRTVPERLQGRLSGTFFAVVSGGPRLGDVETGLAAELGGAQFAVWSGGLACLAGVGVLLWRFPELWADDAGVPRPLDSAARAGAVAEAGSELSEGEPP